MGEVYRARDEKLGRDVALKILSADLASSAEHLRRFEQEARAASALNHPNIIAIYDIGRTADGVAYMAMELVDGDDLRTFSGPSRLPLKQVMRIAVKIADGLAAAHERGIVHRDLKPENVMVSREGFVKILDFGLAKLVTPANDSEATIPHTTPGAVFGTVGYMSPEQAAGRSADFRSDQFALGVMLYEMLASRLPFNEPSAAETLAAIIRDQPAPIDNQSVPPELLRIVFRCLAKDPAERYASTRDLARDLREVRDRVTHPSEPMYHTGPQVLRPKRRVRWVAAVAGAVMLLAGGVVVYQRHKGVAASGPLPIVAVAPFSDVSATPEGQSLADGIAHAISGRISSSGKMRGLDPLENDVKATADPREYGRKMKAAMVVRGTVQRNDGNIRISYALVDTSSGEQLAGETVTGTGRDLFKLEDAVADGVLRAVKLELPPLPAATASADLSGTGSQAAFTEAVGLLRRSRNEASVDRAIKLLEGVLIDARDSAEINALLGQALLNKASLAHQSSVVAQARIYAERAVEIDASLPEAHVTLGFVRNQSGQWKEGAAEFERALQLRPDMKEAILGLADSMAQMGRGEQADRLYQKAIELQPEWASPYNKYGLFLSKQGRCADALTVQKKFAELSPDVPRAYTNLGASYNCLGDYDAALRSYRRAVQLDRNTAAAWSNIGAIMFTLGRYEEAVVPSEEAAKLAPSATEVLANLGDAYRWAGLRDKSIVAYDRAIAAARQAVADNPRNAYMRALLAACLAKRGELQAANDEVTAALKLNPTDPYVLYCAGLINHMRDNRDAALLWLQRAVEVGYPFTDLQRDPEFTGLRNETAFKALKDRKHSA